MADERLERAIYFDLRQAHAILVFLCEQIGLGAVRFRLMPDHFPESLDITSYDSTDEEITHIHPRAYGRKHG